MTLTLSDLNKGFSSNKAIKGMRIIFSLLLPVLALSICGCSGLMGTKTSTDSLNSSQDLPAGALVENLPPFELSVPDSSFSDFEMLVPPAESPCFLLPVGPEGYASLEDLTELLATTLGLLGENQLSLAQDHLFVLEDQMILPLPSGADSLYTAHRLSVQRQTWFLDGILAEKTAFAGDPALSDSLLATEYVRLGNFAFPDSLVPATGVTLPAFTVDLLKIDNQAVSKWVSYFSGRAHRNFQLWLDRKNFCKNLITTILDEYGLPPELIYLAVIESGLNSNAVSSVGAVGPWQFMPGTGKAYKLQQNWWVDERRDLEKSTHAAASYLKRLHARFGDWALVLASYNSGENRVSRRIRQHGHDNFWDMRLPSQTTAYVPKFIAAARIGENPEKYGFSNNSTPVFEYDVVNVRDATDLELMAKCAGVPLQDVVRLNPALLREASPPGMKGYPVHVPRGTGPKASAALSKVPLDKRLTWRRHKVRRGENLGGIARKYGTSVTDIAKLNKMKDVHLIRPGDQLLIPMPSQLTQLARKRAQENGHYVPPSGYKRVSYKVKSGDNLGSIGKKLGVSVRHLRKVNGIYKTNLIHPGQKLYAYRP